MYQGFGASPRLEHIWTCREVFIRFQGRTRLGGAIRIKRHARGVF